MRIFLVFILFCFLINSCEASSADVLSSYEKNLFGQTFEKEKTEKRVSRLENIIFGKTFNYRTNKRIANIREFYKLPQGPQTAQTTSSEGEPRVNYLEKAPLSEDFQENNNVLSNIEMALINKTYPADTDYMRVERLEKALFGASQSGDLDARISRLGQVAENAAPIYNLKSTSAMMSIGGYSSGYEQIPTRKSNGIKNFATDIFRNIFQPSSQTFPSSMYNPQGLYNNNQPFLYNQSYTPYGLLQNQGGGDMGMKVQILP